MSYYISYSTSEYNFSTHYPSITALIEKMQELKESDEWDNYIRLSLHIMDESYQNLTSEFY